ncbi:MAG: ABC transporter permease subunit [Propionicimonas sp.]|uniref:ABC transporter permease n=1 Tax=Propionicimonas sp. TaxID=1955623 RepID=UPI003D14B500
MSAVETPRTPVVDRLWARVLVPLVVPALALAGYQAVATSGRNPYFPPLGTIAAAANELWFGEGLTRDVLPSLANLAVGYVSGLTLGLVVGLVLGRVPVARAIIQPLVSFGLTLPTVALLPVFLIVFGVGAQMQQAVIALSVFFVAVINTADGVRSTDPVLLDLVRVYRIPRLRRTFQVIVPAASTHILAAARVGLSSALLVMVVGEMVGASHGIGAVTLLAQQEFAYARMWAGIVLLAGLGVLFNLGFMAVERRLTARLGLPLASPGGTK